MNPRPINYNMMEMSRTIKWTSQSISQVLVIYLFVQFSKPIVVKSEEESESEED